ncbi:MAG: 4-(cytidine 5'-diphospho)-2-C-methyl-D-erythritol kinase [Candidatus Firestonebacteria bacterium]|nr:4-(cytidine 5'-diphospho)-2-C-methyl-D-erythritol kinase [Candidatus Firestonebacteria bacterium]
MEKIIFKSRAKINLYLKVLDKRGDGYHNIRTIFQEIDLADDITIKKAPKKQGLTVECEDASVPVDEKNLAYRAAALILSEKKINTGLKIIINKIIPVKAGLAGGSSNAAAVLKACNNMFLPVLPFEKIFNLALSLGSDVPFFLKGGTALGEGRGEVLTALPSLAETWFVIVTEGEKASTGAIYAKYRNALTKTGVSGKNILEFISKKNAAGGDIRKILFNDLEIPAGSINPAIYRVKECLLAAGARGALMSGSGPSVFGIADSKEDAESLAARVKQIYSRVIITKSVSPV